MNAAEGANEPAVDGNLVEAQEGTDTSVQMQVQHSQTEMVTFEYLWTIDNFAEYCSEKILRNYPRYQIKSPPFSPPGHDNLIYNIDLRPGGNNQAHADFVTVVLFSTEKNAENTIMFDISIIDCEGNKFNTRSCFKTFTQSISHGYLDYIKRESLFKNADKYLPDGQLTIHFRLNLIIDGPKTDIQRQQDRIDSLLKKDAAEFNFSYYWKNSHYSDIILVAGKAIKGKKNSSKEFSAHKLVLSARSPVFRAMFEHDMVEKKENLVKVTDIKVDVFEQMLQFIYTSTIPKLEEHAAELFKAADKYQLVTLKTICEETLLLQLRRKPELAKEFLSIAELYDSKKLETKCMESINSESKKRFSEFLENKELSLEVSDFLEQIVGKEAEASKKPTTKKRKTSTA